MNDTFKFFIPDIGDCVQLVEDWEFPLHLEGRNHTLINCIKPGVTYGWRSANNTLLVTFKAGTILQVDRIYIRKGKTEWSSITFYVKYDPDDVVREKRTAASSRWASYTRDTVDIPESVPEQKRKGARFWAKLDSVNEMVVRKINKEDIPVDPKPARTRKKKETANG